MAYEFIDGRQYLMPTHFGPMAGPRHSADGGVFPQPDQRGMEIYEVRLRTDAALLSSMLPPQFELIGAPTVVLAAQYMSNIDWLAGRGYNTLGVSVHARFRGKRDVAEGSFLLVLWENLTEPILTGREQLGFSKIHCDLPAARYQDDKVVCVAEWHGHRFFEMKLTGLRPETGPAVEEASPAPGVRRGIMNLRYVPDVDNGARALVVEPTLCPITDATPTTIQQRLTGKAEVSFFETHWRDMPTQFRIVEGLRSLPIREIVSATYVQGIGACDARNQMTLR